MSGGTRFSILGTTNWRSHALFVAGTRLEDRDIKAAERLYVMALSVDDANNAARMNLGGVLLEADDYRNAAEQLRIAKMRVAEADRRSPVYFSASYRLASTLFNLDKIEDAKREIDEWLADVNVVIASYNDPAPLHPSMEKWLQRMVRFKKLSALVGSIRERLQKRAKRKHPPNEQLRTFLNQLLPSAITMRIGFDIALGRDPSLQELDDMDTWKPEAWFQYNVACTYSLVAGARGKAGDAKGEKDYVEKSLKHLDFALRLRPATVDWSRRDPSLEVARKKSQGDFANMVKRHEDAAATP